VTATTATPEQPPVEATDEAATRRLWPGALTFVVYLLTAGLYGVWWFWVTRQEMDDELGRKRSPGRALLEGIGQLIPVVAAYVWYRTINDMNDLRARVNAPAVNVWGWVAALALAVPAIYVLPEVLGPITDLFNNDVRDIIRAVGYALVPAQFLVFGYMVGYWNEYWMEKLGDRAARRRIGALDIVFGVLAVLGLVGLILAAASA
jgi:hypothetical protein